MTQAHYFLVHNQNNKLVINDSYKNLYLSRKIAGNALPLEQMSWDTGCYMRGSYLARRIDYLSDRDEIFAAVAAPAGQGCDFFVFSCIQGTINKAYLCAAQRTNPNGTGAHAYEWNAANTTTTGMNDTSYIPNGIDVFVFSKSKRGNQVYENAGLQVFDANSNCIYDSRYKSARILGGVGFYENISPGKRIAIGGGSSVLCSPIIHGTPYNYYPTMIYGYGTGFGNGYSGTYYKPISCMALTHTAQSTTQNLSYELYSNNSYYIMFDVTNF